MGIRYDTAFHIDDALWRYIVIPGNSGWAGLHRAWWSPKMNLAFTLSKMKRHWKILSSGVKCSDLKFNRITWVLNFLFSLSVERRGTTEENRNPRRRLLKLFREEMMTA